MTTLTPDIPDDFGNAVAVFDKPHYMPDAMGITDDFGRRVFVPGVVNLVATELPEPPDFTKVSLPPHGQFERLGDAASLIAQALYPHPETNENMAQLTNATWRHLVERGILDDLIRLAKLGELPTLNPYDRRRIPSEDESRIRECGIVNMEGLRDYLDGRNISLNQQQAEATGATEVEQSKATLDDELSVLPMTATRSANPATQEQIIQAFQIQGGWGDKLKRATSGRYKYLSETWAHKGGKKPGDATTC